MSGEKFVSILKGRLLFWENICFLLNLIPANSFNSSRPLQKTQCLVLKWSPFSSVAIDSFHFYWSCLPLIRKLKLSAEMATFWAVITKTYLYNVDPFKPHFYIVKLRFTLVYIIFLISAQKHRLLFSLEPPCRGGSNEYQQSMFWAEIWKLSEVF